MSADYSEHMYKEKKKKKRVVSKIDSRAPLDRSPNKNWVENAGGLPMYIRRIANHLHQEKGMEIGRSIATAVNVVKKMCASGDLNFPGKQSANAGSRSEACSAVREWEQKKASARVSKGITGRKMTDDEYISEIIKGFQSENPDDPDTSFEVSGDIEKVDEEKRLVFGWASIGYEADGTLVGDRQGDFLDDVEEIEKSAYAFVVESRDGGEMHVRKGVSTLVESFVSTPEKWEAMGIPEGVLPIGWWVGFRVADDTVWKSVREGKYRMFSVHGRGTRKAMD